jgi:hypothetical protein
MRKSILMFGLTALLMSCGGNNAVSLKPETTNVKGDLKEFYEVVDKNYKVIEEGINNIVNVELKRTSNEFAFNPKSGEFRYGTWYGNNGEEIIVNFGFELLDEENNVIQTLKPGDSGWYGTDYEDIEPLLKLNTDETGTLKLKIDIENKPVKFRILSSLNESKSTDSEDTKDVSIENNSITNNDSSNDWDNTLDEYEKYIDEYIKFYKKAQNGDTSALTEYASLLEKAQSLSEKLTSAQGELTPKQASRFLKLQQKLANAAI